MKEKVIYPEKAGFRGKYRDPKMRTFCGYVVKVILKILSGGKCILADSASPAILFRLDDDFLRIGECRIGKGSGSNQLIVHQRSHALFKPSGFR